MWTELINQRSPFDIVRDPPQARQRRIDGARHGAIWRIVHHNRTAMQKRWTLAV
jgi:hypothetical protein